MSPSKGEQTLTRLSKLHRRLQDLSSEEKGLTEELEALDREEFGLLKGSALEDTRPDTSHIKTRRVEINSRLDELDKEKKAIEAAVEDEDQVYAEWDLKRLERQHAKEKLTVAERRKIRDEKEKELREAQRQLDIAMAASAKTHDAIHEYLHGSKKLKRLQKIDSSPEKLAAAEKRSLELKQSHINTSFRDDVLSTLKLYQGKEELAKMLDDVCEHWRETAEIREIGEPDFFGLKHPDIVKFKTYDEAVRLSQEHDRGAKQRQFDSEFKKACATLLDENTGSSELPKLMDEMIKTWKEKAKAQGFTSWMPTGADGKPEHMLKQLAQKLSKKD